VLVAAGGALAAKGALRRLLEGRRDAAVLTFYDDPPSEADLRRLVDAAPLGPVGPDAREALLLAGAALEPAEFRGVLEKLALHHAAGGATSAEAVRDLSPLGEADVDALLLAVTDGERGRVAPLLARLAAQGVGPVTVAVAATRHVRALMAVAEDPGGPEAGVSRLRPPAGGARRAALLRGSAWPRARREEALRALVALDLQLRSASRAPGEALLERTLLRLARGSARGLRRVRRPAPFPIDRRRAAKAGVRRRVIKPTMAGPTAAAGSLQPLGPSSPRRHYSTQVQGGSSGSTAVPPGPRRLFRVHGRLVGRRVPTIHRVVTIVVVVARGRDEGEGAQDGEGDEQVPDAPQRQARAPRPWARRWPRRSRRRGPGSTGLRRGPRGRGTCA
jgi:hypothetical protein